MKKIIPFQKDIVFKTHIAEVTSISLEHTLHFEEDNTILGEFLISGEYKISDTSTNTDIFNFNLPFHINMDERYELEGANVDIYDFYYEIVNNNVLSVNIEVSINNFNEKEVIKEEVREIVDLKKELEEVNDEDVLDTKELKIEEDRTVESSMEEEIATISSSDYDVEPVSKINAIFSNRLNEQETYATYKIYIVREGDTLEMILDHYGITKEVLSKYNDLNEIKIGDKLIIPKL